MSKINLKTGGGNNAPAQSKKRSSNGSIIFGAILLLLAFGVYGGLMMFNKSKEKEAENIKTEIRKAKEKMDDEKYQALYDFEGRISELESILADKTVQRNVLQELSLHTLETTRYQSLSVKKKDDELTIALTIRAGNLDEISKQVEAFSKLEGVKKNLVTSAAPYSEETESGFESTVDIVIGDRTIISN